MFTTQTAVDIAREGIEAFNAGDWAKFGDLLAEDVTYTLVADNRVFKNRAEALNYERSERTGFPDLHAEIVGILGGENKVGLELIFTGTHKGEMVGASGRTVPPTGKRVNLPAFMRCTIKGGKIVSMVNYSDNLTLLRQLGLIPESFPVPA